jgi:hypothetical protein
MHIYKTESSGPKLSQRATLEVCSIYVTSNADINHSSIRRPDEIYMDSSRIGVRAL